ncbi:MAG TPA: N-acetyltransferase [Clostridiales bacterium]|nr:N-acetyltransferase [Clostridiales bacterium]
MITELDISRIGDIMKIWIEENINAHDFISEDYWKTNYAFVKKALPDATVFVYEDKEEIKGFIGIVEKSYIAGLFVLNKYHSNGIGSDLLERCKQEYPVLKLDVYAKNLKAVSFYRKHGFKIEEEKENDETKELEYSMIWNL